MNNVNKEDLENQEIEEQKEATPEKEEVPQEGPQPIGLPAHLMIMADDLLAISQKLDDAKQMNILMEFSRSWNELATNCMKI